MSWLGRLLERRRLEAELDAELRDHLERQVADYTRAGMAAEEARRRAILELGGLERTKEYCRDARGTRFVDEMAQDVRYGCRVLRKSPGFTAVAVASLALGIGANTGIFSLVDSLLLRALPVQDPERLVRLDKGSWTNPIWEEIRDRQSQLFSSAAAFSDTRFDLAQGGQAEFVEGIWASAGFFDLLGVPAVLGRTFTRGDDRRGGGPDGPVAVISYAFWQRRFGGARGVVGRSLVLNGEPFTVVGVTPPGFFGPTVGRSFDVAAPIGMIDRVQRGSQESQLDGRSFWWLEILARLKTGQTLEEATQALRGVQSQIREATLPQLLATQDLEAYLREGLVLVPAANGFSEVRGQYERPLLILMGVVGLVLLIACANIASLLLARANARRQELAARLALGASRARLARQLLTESLLLAAPGAVLGVAFAHWGSRLLIRQISSSESLVFLDLSLHGRVLLFTLALTVGTALLFGVAPALRAGRVAPHDVLKQQGRSLVGEGPGALGHPLVVAQVALSLVLVFAAGLFLRSFATLAHRDLGLDGDPVLLVGLDAQRSAAKASERFGLFERAREAVAALPGVAHVAASVITPVSGMGWNGRFEVQDGPPLSERDRTAWANAVTPGWFATYGTPILAGRDFDLRDRAGAPGVAIVNEAFVRRFLPGDISESGGAGRAKDSSRLSDKSGDISEESPLGRVLRREEPSGPSSPPLQIVGVVKDAVYQSAREPMAPTVYLPMAQLAPDQLWPFASLGIRGAAGSPALLTRSVAAAIGAVDRDLSLTFRLLADQVGASLMRERIVALLSGFFGGLALLLAAIGLYGVTSYAVSRRRTEIGVRMALGADAAAVVRLVLGHALALVMVGVAIGAAFSLWASRFAGTLLFGLEPRDPATLAGAAAVLLIVGLLAAEVPARRAARIDPAQVLREG